MMDQHDIYIESIKKLDCMTHLNHLSNKEEIMTTTNPAQVLTEHSLALCKWSKIVNECDAHDDINNITYKFEINLWITNHHLSAVKIGPHCKTKTYIAALIYHIWHDREADNTMTVTYSHGNVTDIWVICIICRLLWQRCYSVMSSHMIIQDIVYGVVFHWNILHILISRWFMMIEKF